jgi:hypothetical protein
MSSFQDPDHQQRQSAAAAAKEAMLQKFRAASEDPEVTRRHAARVAMNEARLVRIAEREAAKRAREAELAEQATREAALAAQAQRETKEAEALIVAQSAERQFCWRPSKRPPGMPAMRPAKRRKRSAVKAIDSAGAVPVRSSQLFLPPQATCDRGEVKAEAFASGNRRLEEVDLGRIQAGRPEGRPLIAAEWLALLPPATARPPPPAPAVLREAAGEPSREIGPGTGTSSATMALSIVCEERAMAPRGYWKGYLRLSLVSCPILSLPRANARKSASIRSIAKQATASGIARSMKARAVRCLPTRS